MNRKYVALCVKQINTNKILTNKTTTCLTAFQGRVTGPYPAAVFSEAKSNCETLGQKLLTIDSQEEENSLSSLIAEE